MVDLMAIYISPEVEVFLLPADEQMSLFGSGGWMPDIPTPPDTPDDPSTPVDPTPGNPEPGNPLPPDTFD